MRCINRYFIGPCIVAIIVSVCVAPGACTDNQVTLKVTSDRDTFILKQPVELTGELVNNTDQVVRVYGMEQFSDENMPCLFVEIRTPSGRQQERRTFFSIECTLKSAAYVGEPLAPGERLVFDIFPNQTEAIDRSNEGGWTFPTPGEYGVRLVYEVEGFRTHLWKPPGNRLDSNEIKIQIVAPSSVEKEILEAYWKDAISYGSAWDGKPMWGFDIGELNRVLRKYPDNPLIKYVHFALLNEASNVLRPDLSNVKMHAEYLMSHYPEFRRGLVRRAYGAALIRAGLKAEGLKMLQEALTLDPSLGNNTDFMMLKITTEQGDEKAFWSWKKARMDRGVDVTPQPRKD